MRTVDVNAKAVLKKLRLPAGGNLLIVNAPSGFRAMLGSRAYDRRPSAGKKGAYDFVQVFGETQAELEKLVRSVSSAGRHDCLFWACYPKGGGAIRSDAKRETVWKALGLAGLKPVAQIAIDDTWSALRGRPVESAGT
jgi:hypothetical protein